MHLNRIMMGLVVALLFVIVGLQSAILLDQHKDEDETTATPHPLIGSWIMQTEDGELPALISFAPTGTVYQVDGDGTTALGAWTGTGPNTATSTVLSRYEDQANAPRGWKTVRADIAVDDTNTAFTSTYTIQLAALGNGASSGQLGPGRAEGRRITPEPVGTPVAPLRVRETPPGATPTSFLIDAALPISGAAITSP